jgi:hypothetical protein
MRLEWPRLQLGMELHADEPGNPRNGEQNRRVAPVVWFVESRDDVPRLVTLVPRRIATDDR